MNRKTDLNQMKYFYRDLDTELNVRRLNAQDDESVPIAVGADAVYLLMEQELGTGGLVKFVMDYEANIETASLDSVPLEESRFGIDSLPLFSDADFYLADAKNITPICLALKSLGYNRIDIRDLEARGNAAFLNKSRNPVKVDVAVCKGAYHTRPQSEKSIATLLPDAEDLEGNVTKYNGIKNVHFIDPAAFQKRLISDIAVAGVSRKQIPVKMFQDLGLINRYLSVRKE